MRKLIFVVAALIVSTGVFAEGQHGLTKNSPQLNALGSAWRSQQSQTLSQHDITMGYGGQDISNRPTLAMHTTVA